MINIFLILCLSIFLTSCDKSPSTRTYTEVTTVSPEKAKSYYDSSVSPHGDMNVSDSNAAGMPNMGNADPHAGYTKEQLTAMLQETMQDNPGTTTSPINWVVPKEWVEKASTGMRVATFVNKTNPAAIDCSIVTLGAGAGGIEANIVRWLGQLNIAELPANDLQAFIGEGETIKIKNDLSAEVFDFTLLQKDKASDTPSMIAAILDTPTQRIFVKMMGNKDQIQLNTAALKSLVSSLELR